MAVPLINQSTTLGYMASQLKIHTKLQNYTNVGEISGEPMASIATRVNQMLLQKRMPWKFNRVELSAPGSNAGNGQFLVTQQGVQDYRFAGAMAFVLLNNQAGSGSVPFGGACIDLASTTINNQTYPPINGGTNAITISGSNITVQFTDPHPYQTGNIGQSTVYLSGVENPAFNSVFTWNALTSTSLWTQGYVLTSIPDNLHIVLTATTQQVQTGISHISATGGVVTLTVNNVLSIGDQMTISGMTTNTALNGTSVTLTGATATNVTFASTTSITNGSEAGTLTASASGAPGIYNFGWLESASLQDINNTAFPQPVDTIEAVHRIAPEYTQTGDNINVCVMTDFNNGVLKFRISEPFGTYAMGINCIYQARSPKLFNPGDVFQWPDDLSYVLFEMCLWQAMRFAYGSTAAETQLQMQIAQAAVMSALESEDRESNTIALTPEWSLAR